MPYNSASPDEDFRNRYAPETVGMPTNLAAIATQNLATQDASIAKVNAASRLNTMPGVGAVGSTPQTDATNLATASAMDRADLGNRFGFGSPQYQAGTDKPTPTVSATAADDIAARRQEIAGQRQDISVRLGIMQPPSGTAVVLADPKQRVQLLQNLHALETEDQGLLREHQYNAVDAAKTAHENLARQLHIQSSNGLAKIINGIAGIQDPIGSDAHTVSAMKILGNTTDPEIAAARGTPGFDKILGPYADHAKKSAVTADKIKEALTNYQTATGLEPGSVETTATGGINIRGKESSASRVPATAYADLGKLNAQQAGDAVYLAKEVRPAQKVLLQKKMDATQASIDAWHQTYSPDKSSPVTVAPAATPPPNITSEAHAALKSGEKFWWNGQQLTKK